MTYKGKRKLMRPEHYEQLRAEEIKYKRGAVTVVFDELESLINISQLSRQYFKRSPSYVSQRIHGCVIEDVTKSFNEEEYHLLAESFRDIAKRLNSFADEIDEAENK